MDGILQHDRKHRLNIAHTIDALKDDVLQRLKEITGNDMPTVVFDATGNLKAINNGINFLAHGGRYILVGLQKEDFHFSHPEFHKREGELKSSRNATRDDFEHVMNCMKKGLVNPSTYITHSLSFGEVKDSFPSLLDPATGVIKAMIAMN